MLTFYIYCHERGVVISHIKTENVERTRNMGDDISGHMSCNVITLHNKMYKCVVFARMWRLAQCPLMTPKSCKSVIISEILRFEIIITVLAGLDHKSIL